MVYALAVVAVLILDQWLKYWVTVNIVLNTGTYELIPGVVSLVNIHNYGAAFGILDSGSWRWAFVALALIFAAFAVYAIKSGMITRPFGRWAMVGILAGAIGNCIDRVLYGYVVDMFKLEFVDYAIFNVADMFISCCGVLFCLYIIFGGERSTVSEEEASSKRSAKKAKSRRRFEEYEDDVADDEEYEVPARRAARDDEDAKAYVPRHERRAKAPVAEAPEVDVAPSVKKAPAEPVKAAQEPVKPAPEPVELSEPKVEAAVPAPKAEASESKSDGEFSLEDILAEFGSK